MIYLQVLSKDSSGGPTGVTVSLYPSKGDEGAQILETKDGKFHFSGVQPGDYLVQARHKDYMFEKAEVQIKVMTKHENKNLQFPSNLS